MNKQERQRARAWANLPTNDAQSRRTAYYLLKALDTLDNLDRILSTADEDYAKKAYLVRQNWKSGILFGTDDLEEAKYVAEKLASQHKGDAFYVDRRAVGSLSKNMARYKY